VALPGKAVFHRVGPRAPNRRAIRIPKSQDSFFFEDYAATSADLPSYVIFEPLTSMVSLSSNLEVFIFKVPLRPDKLE